MERREYRRAPIPFPIRLNIGDIDKFTTEYAADIGAGGIFLPMPSPLPEGEDVDIEFFLEPVKKVIRTRARVVRSNPPGQEGEGTVGMGLEFLDISKDTRRFIDLVVGKYNREHPEGRIESPTPPRTTFGVYIGLPDDEELRCEHAHVLEGGDIFVRSDRQWPRKARVDLQVWDPSANRWLPAEGEIQGVLYSAGMEELTPGPGVAVAVRDPSEDLLRVLPSLSPAPATA